MWLQIIQIWCIALIFSQCAAKTPSYIECLSSDDCGLLGCCVLGMTRFSIPSCRPFHEIGQQCIAGYQAPFNSNLTYPDGQTVEFSNVYRLLCPCAKGLVCGDGSMCMDGAINNKDNITDIND